MASKLFEHPFDLGKLASPSPSTLFDDILITLHAGSESPITISTYGSSADIRGTVGLLSPDVGKRRMEGSIQGTCYSMPLGTIIQLDSSSSVWSLEQGVSAPLVGAACENACLFLTYNKFQDIILNIRPTVGGVAEVVDGKPRRRELTLGELALAAGAAGAAASFLLCVPTFDIAFHYAGRAL